MLFREDLIYLADRRNAPYGTKSPDEILKFTENNIKLLHDCGAESVLIACCTASSLHHRLPKWAKEISLPIIRPAAIKAAEAGQRIAVIATRHTSSSGVFKREITAFSDLPVFEFDEQGLVALVEEGNRDGRLSPECKSYLNRLAGKIKESGADTLILGCTHFSHLENELKILLPYVRIISPAREGAIEISRKTKINNKENRKTIYISS